MCTRQSEHVLGQPPRKTTQPHPRKQTQRVHLRFMHTERHYDQRSSRWSRAEQAKHPPTAERKGIGLSAHLTALLYVYHFSHFLCIHLFMRVCEKGDIYPLMIPNEDRMVSCENDICPARFCTCERQ